MGLSVVTPPSTYPVSLEEARQQCRVIDTSENAKIEALIRAAIRHTEKSLDISLAKKTLKLTLDKFTCAIELPQGPVTNVISVGYYDGAGQPQSVPSSDYTVDLTSERQWVVLNSAASWPTPLDAINAVSVTYEAGFEALPAQYDDIKHGILMLIGHWFANREAVGPQTYEVPIALESIFQPYRKMMV